MLTSSVDPAPGASSGADRTIDEHTEIRTPDQRVRVFVSSTLGDLNAERRAATEAIRQLRLTPVLFELGARRYPPRELYRAYLRQSDVFVGIYAQSYGWVALGMDVSGLEDEYRLSAGKPRLIYVKRAPQREPRLNDLLDTIRAEAGVSYRHFQDADELRQLVADDLALLLTERFTSALPASAATLPTPRRPLIDRVVACVDALAGGHRGGARSGAGRRPAAGRGASCLPAARADRWRWARAGGSRPGCGR
jgi:hypothetical protein